MQVKYDCRTKKLMHKTKSQDENVLINYVITFAVSLFRPALYPSMQQRRTPRWSLGAYKVHQCI